MPSGAVHPNISPPLRNPGRDTKALPKITDPRAERWTPAFAGEAIAEAAPEYIHNLSVEPIAVDFPR
jgi:hypothetical protein